MPVVTTSPNNTRAQNVVDHVPIVVVNPIVNQWIPTKGTLVRVENFGQPYEFISTIPLHSIISTLIQGVEHKRIWSTNLLRYFHRNGMTCPLAVDRGELGLPEIKILCNDAKFYWTHDNWESFEGRSFADESWLYHTGISEPTN